MKTCSCIQPCMCFQGDAWGHGHYGLHPHFQPSIYTPAGVWPPGHPAHYNPNHWGNGGFTIPTFTKPAVDPTNVIHEVIKSSIISLFEICGLSPDMSIDTFILAFSFPENKLALLADRLRIRINFIMSTCNDWLSLPYAHQCVYVINNPVTAFDQCPFVIEEGSDLQDLNKLSLFYKLIISIRQSQSLAANIDLLKQVLYPIQEAT